MATDFIPKEPKQFNASGVMQRLVDAIFVRYSIATSNISNDAVHFRATPESMSMLELQKHILILIGWVSKSLGMESDKEQTKAETFEEFQSLILSRTQLLSDFISTLSDEELSEKTIYLKRNDTHYNVWFLINGPLSDAIHHIGQIVTWRRIAGNPVPKLSPFTGQSY